MVGSKDEANLRVQGGKFVGNKVVEEGIYFVEQCGNRCLGDEVDY